MNECVYLGLCICVFKPLTHPLPISHLPLHSCNVPVQYADQRKLAILFYVSRHHFSLFYFLQPEAVLLFEGLSKSYWSHFAQMYRELEMLRSPSPPETDLSYC